MSRKILFYGVGFDDSGEDAQIEVRVDGELINSGVIVTDTTQAMSYSGSDVEGETVIAEWIAPDEAGTHALSITAVSGNILYTNTETTYIGDEDLENPTLLNVRHVEDSETGLIISDPNENIKIDGVPDENDFGRLEKRSDYSGQWNIPIFEQTTMTCDFVIDVGLELPSVSGSINVNTATFDELRSLHGIDEARAQDIIDGREWESINDLTSISGISQEMVDGWDIVTEDGE